MLIENKNVFFNLDLIEKLINDGKVVVFTLNKSMGGKEIISWNTGKRFFPKEMSEESLRIGYLLENARKVGLDDLAMPDQPLNDKLIEDCHELTTEEIIGYYDTEIARKQGTLWNVDKNFNAIFMAKNTHDEVLKKSGRNVSLVFPCADCAVVRFYDPEHDVIGITHSDAVHTGQKIIPKCVLYMKEKFGTDISKLQVFVGAFAFEGWTYDKLPDFASEKDKDGKIIGINSEWEKYIVPDKGKYLINYGDKIFDQLLISGINIDNLYISPDNTLTNDNYFSNSRSFNSRIDGIATYREGRNLVGITFSKKEIIDSMKKQHIIMK